jgi:Rieske Fe-S protein
MDQMMEEISVSRRGFIRQLTVVGTVAAALPLLGGYHPALAADPGTAVGKSGDFKVGEFKKVTLPDGSSIYVTKTTDGYRALSSKCTHRGCEVLWVPARKSFQCPCHGGTFDATGKNTGGPPPRPLASLTAKEVDGTVYVTQAA